MNIKRHFFLTLALSLTACVATPKSQMIVSPGATVARLSNGSGVNNPTQGTGVSVNMTIENGSVVKPMLGPIAPEFITGYKSLTPIDPNDYFSELTAYRYNGQYYLSARSREANYITFSPYAKRKSDGQNVYFGRFNGNLRAYEHRGVFSYNEADYGQLMCNTYFNRTIEAGGLAGNSVDYPVTIQQANTNPMGIFGTTLASELVAVNYQWKNRFRVRWNTTDPAKSSIQFSLINTSKPSWSNQLESLEVFSSPDNGSYRMLHNVDVKMPDYYTNWENPPKIWYRIKAETPDGKVSFSPIYKIDTMVPQ
jgi:hypothetical protein